MARDSAQDLVVVVTEADIACAVPLDPSECAIAQAIRRMYGSQHVEVGKSVIQAEIPAGRGQKGGVQRWRLRRREREDILHFDRTGEWKELGPLVARKTEGTAYSLPAKAEQNRRKRAGKAASVPQRKNKREPDVRLLTHKRAAVI